MRVSSAPASTVEKSRRKRLLVPIAAMTLGGLTVLVLLAVFLISWFDATALERERHMVEQGFQRQLQQFDAVIVPMADWDKAVTRIDHRLDANFVDAEFGIQLYTFNGCTRTFLVDGDGKVIYASANGKRAGAADFAPFGGITQQLLTQIRPAEAHRPPIHPNRLNQQPVTRPIQANSVVRVEGEVYIVIATLIQPDLGLAMPRGPRAPVVITAMPVNHAMLSAFAGRYLVDDLTLVDTTRQARDRAYFPLLSHDGREVAALAWTPRQPGTALIQRLLLPLAGAFVLLGLVGWTIVRRSAVVVDELIASEAMAKHLAYHDPLTFLPNRTKLFERLPAFLAAIGPRTPLLAILGIDLDRFKEVNDTLGHQAGDELIIAVAERLRDLASGERTFFAARLGGDEFVLLYLAPDRAHIEDLAQRCLARIMHPVDSEYGRLDVGCSIGVTIIENRDVVPSNALRQADLALYCSKAAGRACVTYFEPRMDEALAKRRKLEANLRTALSNQAFYMVYQPQVDGRGEIQAVEALLRWSHPELGQVPPSDFILLAEESGLILSLGEFVLRRVFEETRDWHHLRIAINVSAIQMRAPGFASQVTRLVAQAGIDPTRYEIELTETALLTNEPAAEQNLGILKRLGFTIVLDDFGTGYSSLSLLHRFRVDKIKIDRSFVADLDESEEADALVRAILELARAFRLGVIAEGVETEAQMQLLLGAGCREFQGFLTGMPSAAPGIAKLFPRSILTERRAGR